MTRLLIIGAGIAAVSAADAARRVDSGLQITMVSDEQHLPYYRTRLSHLLGQPAAIEQLLLHPQTWYDERRLELALGVHAVAVDATARTVSLADGRTLAYDALVLANGSRSFLPPVPGNDRSGVFTLRTFDDGARITARLDGRRRVVISGGGPLGLEAAWALKQAGKDVTVLERGEGLLRKQLDGRGAELLQQIAGRNGIAVMTGAELSSIDDTAPTDGGIATLSARLADGRVLPADAVLFSTGIRPNTELGATAGVTVMRGIVVDERMRTGIAGIFAAGDVAVFGGKAYGIWPVALEQGRVAGTNAAGGDAVYAEIAPSNTVMVLGTSIFSAGEIAGEGTLAVRDEDAATGSYRAAYIRDGVLVGVSLIGKSNLGTRLKQAIDAKRRVPTAGTFADIEAAV